MLGSYPGVPQSCVTEFLLLYTHDVSLSSPQFVRAVAVATVPPWPECVSRLLVCMPVADRSVL